MKRWVVLAVLVVGLSSAATVAYQYLPDVASASTRSVVPVGGQGRSKSTGAQPKAVVEGTKTYEFGTLPQKYTGKHAWVVRNEGKGDLDLWMVRATCSCTLAKFKNGEKATVRPGESTEIVLEFETRENNGDYEKGATIGTSDPDLPEFDLHVHGKVYPAIITTAPQNTLNYMVISNDLDDHPYKVAVFSNDRPETKILKTETSRPKDITVSHEPLTEEECKELKTKRGHKVTVHVKSGLPLGVFREEVVLTTDHPKQPEVRLTVSGRMTGSINLLPDRLIMHQIDGKAGGSASLILSVRNNRATKFEVVKAPKGVQVAVDPGELAGRKGRYRLTVTVPPDTPSQEIEDEVVLKTDHPKADQVIVPVSVWVHNPDAR